MSRSEQRRIVRRNLRVETLENRLLLAGDTLRQNVIHPEDANGDGVPTALDALVIINELNGATNTGSPNEVNADVNGDGVVTPSDVLRVINSVNSRRRASGVPHGQRISALEKAKANGTLPAGITTEQADEILATLKHGGRPEHGDRYRDGKMINLKALAESLPDPSLDSSIPVTPATQQPASQPLMSEPDSSEGHVSLDLFESAQNDLTDNELWQAANSTLNSVEQDALSERVGQALSTALQDVYTNDEFREWIDRELYERWLNALEDEEAMPQQILLEIQAFRSTLGDMHEQIAQMFARLDLEAILENLPDLDILVTASTPQQTESAHDEAIAELVTSQVLRPF